MYNSITKKMLLEVSVEDAKICKNQDKYSVCDSFSTIEFYVSDTRISYRVRGDAYTIAMTKWLQLILINGNSLKDITLESMVEIFNLPEVKFRNVVQIFEIIEKINEA